MLDSLTKALEGFNNWELIIIDNNSLDGTYDYCIKRFEKNEYVTILSNQIPSAYVSRNLGIRSSKGQSLIFSEDDLIIPSDWFWKINNVFKESPDNPNRVFTFELRSRGRLSRVLTNIHEFEKNRFLTMGEGVGIISTPSLLIKKEVFDDYGLFMENNRGGDFEYELRLLKNHENIEKLHDIFVYHEFVADLAIFFKRSFAYGYSFAENKPKVDDVFNIKESFVRKIIKNIKMPFLWGRTDPDNYFLTVVLSFIHEVAFIAGGIAQKRFINKNPVI